VHQPVIRLSPEDNIAVATRKLPRGSVLGGLYLIAQEEIPLGHKVALRPITEGEAVLKFGVPIGRATRTIMPGELVHVHNIRSDYITNDIDHFEE
jgi:altronate hydrolase